jgi:hypothetical protein
MTAAEEPLADCWGDFIVALRMREGFGELPFSDISRALMACVEAWEGRSEQPRNTVNILVDIVPAMQASVPIYAGDEADRITEVAYKLQELIWRCVALPDE